MTFKNGRTRCAPTVRIARRLMVVGTGVLDGPYQIKMFLERLRLQIERSHIVIIKYFTLQADRRGRRSLHKLLWNRSGARSGAPTGLVEKDGCGGSPRASTPTVHIVRRLMVVGEDIILPI